MTNDKLPDDELTVQFLESISNEADEVTNEKANGRSTAYKYGYRDGYFIGATAYASWMIKHDELKVILQEFVSNHEAGLLPNRFVYEKAIKILNDGK